MIEVVETGEREKTVRSENGFVEDEMGAPQQPSDRANAGAPATRVTRLPAREKQWRYDQLCRASTITPALLHVQ